MKVKLLMKTLLAAAGLCVGSMSAWADDLPTPVYSQNFESASTDVGSAGSNFGITGATLTGSGVIDTGDTLFGKYYRNNGASSTRQNYLTLTTTAFTAIEEAGTETATISFWLNAHGIQDTNNYGSIFVAYGGSGNTNHDYPFSFDIRANLTTHSSLGETYFDQGAGIQEKNDWRTVGSTFANSWHHVAVVYSIDKTSSPYQTVMKYYIDGVLVQTRNITSYSAGITTDITMFEYLHRLSEFVIGGNSPVWADPDNGYAYDEIAIYKEALTAEQIAQIRNDKLYGYTVNAVDGSYNVLKTLASGYDFPGTINYAYPHYINVNGTLYVKNAAGDPYYQGSFTLSSDNQVEKVTYTASSHTGVLYFSEAEDVLSATSSGGASSRCSGMAGGYASTATAITTLPAGTYTIYFGNYADQKTHLCIYKNSESDENLIKDQTGTGSWDEANTGEFTLDETSSILLKGGSSGGYVFDYISIEGTTDNEIVGNVDCSTGFMSAHRDFTINPGQTINIAFKNHGKGDFNWNNWLVRLSGTTGVNHTFRADNYVLGDHNSEVSITEDGGDINWTDFLADMQNSSVTMAITYAANGMFTIAATSTGTHTYVHNFAYNEAKSGAITVELGVEHSWLEVTSSSQVANATIGDNGYASLATAYGLDFSGVDGLTAYVVTKTTNDAVTLTSVEEQPANSGVILKGAQGTYSIPVKVGATYAGTNLLSAAVTATAITANTAYILQGGKFHLVTADSTVPAGKAYLLKSNVPSNANTMRFVFGDETQGVETVKEAETFGQGPVYNLNGQRVSKAAKGLFVKNGKKVVVK